MLERVVGAGLRCLDTLPSQELEPIEASTHPSIPFQPKRRCVGLESVAKRRWTSCQLHVGAQVLDAMTAWDLALPCPFLINAPFACLLHGRLLGGQADMPCHGVSFRKGGAHSLQSDWKGVILVMDGWSRTVHQVLSHYPTMSCRLVCVRGSSASVWSGSHRFEHLVDETRNGGSRLEERYEARGRVWI